MTTGNTAESRWWPQAGWWLAVALVMAVQLGFIFALGSRSDIAPRKTIPPPIVQLTGNGPNELLLLSDPTLFVLPHQQGFSGRAWLQIPPFVTRPFKWTEPQRWLPLAEQGLGNVFNDFMHTNNYTVARFETMPAPELTVPETEPLTPLTGKSTVRIEGSLAGRRLLAQPDLTSWRGTDVLDESVVQVLVDAVGNVLSAFVRPPGCGSADADQLAVKLAKSARFEPSSRGNAGATWGTMIFNWPIVSAVTNAPAVNP